jgi:cysteinyl-tRNA synthetase
MIRFFNTLGRETQSFKPIKEGEVRMYTCGPTVWNYPHVGNYRTFLFEDLLRRFLRYEGFKVTQVMNLTDVDDRIIKVVREKGLKLEEFTSTFEKAFFDDLDFLKMQRAEAYPKATDHIPEMVNIIQGLLDKGIAYQSEDGSIYYNISKFPLYGRLSGLKLGELKAGARVRQDDYGKDSAQDFALWKAWDPADGEVFWESPAGRGRPGWHIECSAMSMKYLGEQFDIHTGGVDNIFPHHENEIAQSEAYTGKKFANYWLHSEHLQIKETKMSKRLGNVITINDLRDKGIEGTTVRFFLLSAHYRAQLNFTDSSLEQSAASVKRINEFVSRLREAGVQSEAGTFDEKATTLANETRAEFIKALENDLDAPAALAAVFRLISDGNVLLDREKVGIVGVEGLLRFMIDDFDTIFAVVQETAEGQLSPNIRFMLSEREEARKNKNWAIADELRTKLRSLGIEVQDTPQGQKWRKISSE